MYKMWKLTLQLAFEVYGFRQKLSLLNYTLIHLCIEYYAILFSVTTILVSIDFV